MKLHSLSILLACVILYSCGNNTSQTTEQNPQDREASPAETKSTELSWEKNGLKVYAVEDSPEFPDAILKLKTPEKACYLKDGKVKFSFEVENYELQQQTNNSDKHCGNSDKGQHIHVILNNQPYTAHYDTDFGIDLDEGFYVMLSFLSRSYHESIKNSTAYQYSYFSIGEVPDISPDTMWVMDPKTYEEKIYMIKNKLDSYEHLFYSRPKGSYTCSESQLLLLDFYLINTTLAEDGNKVRATIDGSEFILPKWSPYGIEGFTPGEHTIKLELIDNEGKNVPGPFNIVERTITIQSAESQS